MMVLWAFQFCSWLLVCLSVGLTASANDRPICESNEVVQVVERLGQGGANYNYAIDFAVLATQPAQAACHLIQHLRVIQQTKIASQDVDKSKSSLHVIWCIRALRYITGGKDFQGETKYSFEKSEPERKYFLTMKSAVRVPFFKVWMSRDIIYVAPPDAQPSIIRQWEKWYTEEAKSFKYRPSVSIDDWYF